MRPARDYRDYLNDILLAAGEAISFVEEMDFSDFSADRRTYLAVVRSLEIMGEAARQIPENMRDFYPVVPWQDMGDMRNKLIHEYFGVDLEVVWRTVREDLPPLFDSIRRILAELGGASL